MSCTLKSWLTREMGKILSSIYSKVSLMRLCCFRSVIIRKIIKSLGWNLKIIPHLWHLILPDP